MPVWPEDLSAFEVAPPDGKQQFLPLLWVGDRDDKRIYDRQQEPCANRHKDPYKTLINAASTKQGDDWNQEA